MTREIVDVKMTKDVALLRAESLRLEGRTNISVHQEKVRAESLWRLAWVIVADVRVAPPADPGEPVGPIKPRRRR